MSVVPSVAPIATNSTAKATPTNAVAASLSLTAQDCLAVPVIPAVPTNAKKVTDLGAVPDDGQDTAAIELALDNLQPPWCFRRVVELHSLLFEDQCADPMTREANVRRLLSKDSVLLDSGTGALRSGAPGASAVSATDPTTGSKVPRKCHSGVLRDLHAKGTT